MVNCCPCPDHASNWVAVVYQSRRLVVESESEVPFSRSGESLSVKVAGVEPSCKVGDAEIAFGVNGEVVKQGKYTVLGVGIESGYVPNVGTVDLRALNAFSPAFGLPVPVGTNDASMTGICLSTRVRLPSGNVHVGLEDVTGDFTVRYYDRTDQEWRVLVDSSSPSRDVAFSHWRRMVNGSADAYDEDATVYVTSTNAGSATLVYRYWNVLGGRVRFEISGAGNLVQYGGYPLPYEVDIGPGETVMFTNVYRAVAASGSENDIVARATFEDAVDDFYDMSTARATAVKVEVEPFVSIEGTLCRHLLGVREEINVNVTPSVIAQIETGEDWLVFGSGANSHYQCPITSASGGVTIQVGSCSYTPSLIVIEPQGVEGRNVTPEAYGLTDGHAGGIGMWMPLHVLPASVCFNKIAMVEEPTGLGFGDGYFSQPLFESCYCHSIANGAGTWHNVALENFFFDDHPAMAGECPSPWSGGSITWSIPIAWGEHGSTRMVQKVSSIAQRYLQVFSINVSGSVKIEKFGFWVERPVCGPITHSTNVVGL